MIDTSLARFRDAVSDELLTGPAVVLAAAPGDEVLGAGAAMQQMVLRNERVRVVIFSDVASDAGPPSKAVVPPAVEAVQFSIAAAESLGYGAPVFWQEPEGNIVYRERLVLRILAFIRTYGATRVFAPSPEEPLADRFALALAAREAVRRFGAACGLVNYRIDRLSDATHALKNQSALGAKADTIASFPHPSIRVKHALRLQSNAHDAQPDSLPQASPLEIYRLCFPGRNIEPLAGMADTACWLNDPPAQQGPSVSIIIRTTGRDELDTTRDSVALQTYHHIEVVLVDVLGQDALGSQSRCGRFPVRMVSLGRQLNRGAACNAGLASAQGDYVLFLDDDDWIYPDHVSSLLTVIRANESALVAQSNTLCVRRDKHGNWLALSHYNAGYDASRLLVENFLPIHSVMFDRALVGENLRFDETLNVYEDWDFWIQLSYLSPVLQTRRTTAIYRISDTSGFGQRTNDPVADIGYRAVIEKWHPKWTIAQVEQIARDAASARRLSVSPRTCVFRELENRPDLNENPSHQLGPSTILNGATLDGYDHFATDIYHQAPLPAAEIGDCNDDGSEFSLVPPADSQPEPSQTQVEGIVGHANEIDCSTQTDPSAQQHQRPEDLRDERIKELVAEIDDYKRDIDHLTEQAAKEKHANSELRIGNSELKSHNIDLSKLIKKLLCKLDTLQTTASWQLSTPLRMIAAWYPKMVRGIAAGPKLLWWTMTLRLPQRLRIHRDAKQLLLCGLFDRTWYIQEYPEIVLRGLNPVLHWVAAGWKEGRYPNSLFDTAWYLAENPDVAQAGVNPLVHFMETGAFNGRNPNPLFHSAWYLERYKDVADARVNPLAHYLRRGVHEGRDPNALFDTDWYLAHNPDVAASGVNPLAHYLRVGVMEGRDPNPYFDTNWYLKKNPDVAKAGINPLAHYFWAGAAEHRAPSASFDPQDYQQRYPEVALAGHNPLVHFLSQSSEYAGMSKPRMDGGSEPANRFAALYQSMLLSTLRQDYQREYVPESEGQIDRAELPFRLIAFYLPQFHPIPENNHWWGKGFTEWTNVTRALPQFEGHYQPRLPDALGFYDLRVKEVQREQIELAKRYGVYGFCYHHYWFAGKRLLERPLQQLLEDRSLNFPFCICWANENWTRRWDGREDEILLGQQHSHEDDLAFIAELEPALRDPRYIKVAGRPLLVVYRPQLFPDPEATARLWRDYAQRRGFPEPYLVNVWSFPEAIDPRSIGFDAAVEFPPHQYPCSEIKHGLQSLNPAFDGHVFDYDACVEHAEAARHLRRPFDLFPGVMTAWDNTPRRLEHGNIYANATPEAYQRWMIAAGERALDFAHPDKRMVFVNAWNEWAEGTYLEPDRRFGYAYLQATREVLEGLSNRTTTSAFAEDIASDVRKRPRILLIGHDAHRHGAQLIALNLARLFAQRFGYDVRVWLLDGGDLLRDYQRVAGVDIIGEPVEDCSGALRDLRSIGFDIAITNTVVTGNLVPDLKREGYSVLSLVHEMPALIRERALEDRAQVLSRHADYVVFPAETVRMAFDTIARTPKRKTLVLPQGIYQSLEAAHDARASVESELGLPPDAVLVLNAGYGDPRKGFDWFLDCAREVADADPRFHFLWLGTLTPEFEVRFESERRVGRLVTNLHQLPFTDSIARYFAAADVFLLTSREDPFPSVVLEALACGLPLVAFDGSGGHCELLRETPGLGALAAPMGDLKALATTLMNVVAKNMIRPEHRANRAQLATARFDFGHYGWSLLRQLNPALRSISVVVPNYNYAQYLQPRLESIFDQTYPIYEVIVLDDASTDSSPDIIRQVSADHNRRIRFIANAENSRSVFKQWAKGIREARGELVWIAEADDLAKPKFLECLLAAMGARDDILFAFSDSEQIDEHGKRLGTSYANYCNEYTDLDFSGDFTLSADQFLSRAIGVKNNVLNVSAALFAREQLAQALAAVEHELPDWTIAGDWRLYVEICKQEGCITYIADQVNIHRRHENSVVGSNKLQAHIDETSRMHQIVVAAVPLEAATLEQQGQYTGSLVKRVQSEA